MLLYDIADETWKVVVLFTLRYHIMSWLASKAVTSMLLLLLLLVLFFSLQIDVNIYREEANLINMFKRARS